MAALRPCGHGGASDFGDSGWKRRLPSQPRNYFGHNRIHRDRNLLTRRQVLHCDRPGLDVAVARYQRNTGAGTSGRAHRAFEPAITIGKVNPHPGRAQSSSQHRQPELGRLAKRHAEHVAPGSQAL